LRFPRLTHPFVCGVRIKGCDVSNALVHAWTDQLGEKLGIVATNHGTATQAVTVNVTLPPPLVGKLLQLVAVPMGPGAEPTVAVHTGNTGKWGVVFFELAGRSAIVYEIVQKHV
jgi:hypothetical protein